jgi:uncharacterized glyoxalase superfamily protein PhnB
MDTTSRTTTQRLFPSVRFVDARAGIAFLHDAFGFEPQVVHDHPDGSVAHAQLVLLGEIVMCGSSRDDDYPVRSPREVGGVTGGIYVALDDAAAVDAVHRRAVAAGAEIIRQPHDTDYGSHDFVARDPEGYIWSFGTYRPEEPGRSSG